MVTVVVVINVLISIVCLYVAWRIGKLRRRIAKLADKIIAAERGTHAVLRKAPTGILKGQQGAQHLQERYQQLENRLQRLQQVLMLLSVGQKVWQGRRRAGTWRDRGSPEAEKLHRLGRERVYLNFPLYPISPAPKAPLS